MKKITYLLTIILFVFALQAKAELLVDKSQKYDIVAPMSISTQALPSAFLDIKKSKTENTHAVEFKSLEETSGIGSMFTHWNHQTPMAYDPSSGMLYIVTIIPETNAEHFYTGFPIVVYSSTNLGTNWSKDKVLDYDGSGAFTPSINVTNYDNATSYNDIPYTAIGQYCVQTETGFSQENQGVAYIFYADGEAIEDLQRGPSDYNSGDGQYWRAMKLDSYYDDDESQTYAACVLNPADMFNQYGTYGFLALDNMSQDILVSEIPQDWLSVFRQSDEYTRSYNGHIETGVDDKGNVYSAVINLFADNETARVPAVAKSDDFGETWSEFNRMPESLFGIYGEATGFENAFPWESYQSIGFIVHGEDSYSLFFTMALYNTEEDETCHMVEAKYNGTSWSMHTVGEDLNLQIPVAFFSSQSHEQSDMRKQLFWRKGSSIRGYEIQAAKTADDGSVLVKWTNYSKSVDFTTPFTITENDDDGNEQDLQIGGWWTSDVFFSYRASNETSWTGSINSTDDDTHYVTTWIPNIVPSLEEIPLFYHSNGSYPATEPIMSVPYEIRSQIAYYSDFTQFGLVDLTGGSVKTNKVYDFQLKDIVPNPASNMIEIPYILNQAANVQIDVFTSMGQKVASVINNYQSEGPHAVNYNVSHLSSGSYYVTMTIGGQRLTQVLNVIK